MSDAQSIIRFITVLSEWDVTTSMPDLPGTFSESAWRGLDSESAKTFKRWIRIGKRNSNRNRSEQLQTQEPGCCDLACGLMVVLRKRVDPVLREKAWKSGCNRTAIAVTRSGEQIQHLRRARRRLSFKFRTEGDASHRDPEIAHH